MTTGNFRSSIFGNRVWVFFLAVFANVALFAHGISEASRQRMIDGGNLEYVRLGAEHMITGIDHLLFLFGVMFFLTRFVDIIKFVSAFTIGHTITLIAATYFQITANYYLVDAFIALTVIYKGFENLDGFRKYLNTASPNLLFMVLLFGLVHGFGLSTRLQQLPVAENGAMLWHILSFNLGVEIGQIVALLIMWGLLRIWQHREQFLVFSKVANAGLVVAGALLLVMQLHGYSHSEHADNFPISRDDHSHAHQEMQEDGHSHDPDGSHAGGSSSAETDHSHGPESDHSHDSPDGPDPSVPSHY